jgi:pilus assembly protein CpaC
MIGGLMQNSSSSSIDRAPGLGNLPILGALFRSTEYRKNQTELVVIVTPYLVKPVSERDIHLPTDGLRSPSDPELLLLGRTGAATSDRPMPSLAAPPAAKPTREKSTKARLPSPGFGQ